MKECKKCGHKTKRTYMKISKQEAFTLRVILGLFIKNIPRKSGQTTSKKLYIRIKEFIEEFTK